MNKAILPAAVIVAIDGSIDSRQAVVWAAQQAQLEHRPLVLVHATGEAHDSTPLWLPGAGPRPVQEILDEAVALAEETYPDLWVTAVSVPGDPRTALVDVSTSAHLLVLGSHGRGPLGSKVLGSVSVAVAKHATCPVVVHRPTTPGKIHDGVVVAADGTAESVPVLDFAFRQASIHRLPLTVVHFLHAPVPAVVGVPGPGPAYDRRDAEAASLLVAESVAGLAEKYPDVHVTTRVDRGRVEEGLTAGQRPWNLIVVGRHPVHLLSPSASTAVIERANSVVAVVPEAAPTAA